MNGYRQILMQPLLQRRAAGSLWMTWLLLALLVIGGIVAGVQLGKPAVGFATMIPLAGLLIMWWLAFIQNAIR